MRYSPAIVLAFLATGCLNFSLWDLFGSKTPDGPPSFDASTQCADATACRAECDAKGTLACIKSVELASKAGHPLTGDALIAPLKKGCAHDEVSCFLYGMNLAAKGDVATAIKDMHCGSPELAAPEKQASILTCAKAKACFDGKTWDGKELEAHARQTFCLDSEIAARTKYAWGVEAKPKLGAIDAVPWSRATGAGHPDLNALPASGDWYCFDVKSKGDSSKLVVACAASVDACKELRGGAKLFDDEERGECSEKGDDKVDCFTHGGPGKYACAAMLGCDKLRAWSKDLPERSACVPWALNLR